MRRSTPISPRRALFRIGAFSALAFLACAPGACNPITNTTAVQCTSEAECLSLGPEFAGTTCDPATKTCKKPVESLGCTTNQECLDAAGGEAAICRKSDGAEGRRCVRLKSPECPNVFTKAGNAELANDDVIVIGSLTPENHTELGTVMTRALQMAHNELSNGFLRGLPAAAGSKGSRPIAVVSCREFGAGFEGAIRAANHLSKEVRVPLVIGPVDPGNAGLVASQAFLPNKVLTILPTGVISSLANLPSPIAPIPLIWRLLFDDRALAAVISSFIRYQLQTKLQNDDGIAPPYRVAFLSGADLSSQSVQAQVMAQLKYNGTIDAPNSLAQNQAEGSCADASDPKRPCLKVFNFGDINDTLGNPDPDATINATLQDLYAYQPHVIIHPYGPAGIPKVFFPCEGGFPGKKPYHIGATAVFNGFGPLFPFLNAVPGRNARLFSVQQYANPNGLQPPFPVTSAQVGGWLSRFNTQFPEFKNSVSQASQNVWLLYDAFWLAAYAIQAVGDKPITGENLAGVLDRLNNGQVISTYYSAGGPNGPEMNNAFSILKSGQSFQLQGLFGTMKFDTKVAAPVYGLEMTCPNPLKAGGGTKGSGFHVKVDSGRVVVTSPDGMTDNPPTSPLNDCPPPTL